MAKKKVETKEKVAEELSSKEKLKLDKKEAKKKMGGFWKEFKKFISRGNAFDLSVGVVIGGAFTAIVTALTNIILSICTWTVPGGLKGLVTILPAASDAQKGLQDVGQSFYSHDLTEMISIVAKNMGVSTDAARTEIMSKYTLHGSLYVFNGSAIIDWGTFINAVLSFLVVAIVLFIIIKIIASVQKASRIAREKALEEYYKKHPEERPAPVIPGLPEPTDHQLLKGILAELQRQNGTKAKTKKTGKK